MKLAIYTGHYQIGEIQIPNFQMEKLVKKEAEKIKLMVENEKN